MSEQEKLAERQLRQNLQDYLVRVLGEFRELERENAWLKGEIATLEGMLQ
jgi:hypothetical protein